ncbi:MAG: ABC transporter ATP-binding protein/permease [Lachnospiraceae bacterium]|nr:ABC transporter ATP-binding protein/permease [Lachnospiraceae bacterium]
MKRLLVYLKGYKKESILSPLFKMLEASFELLVPLVIASMIDIGIADGNLGQGDRAYIIKCFFILISLGFVGLICAVTAQYFAAKAATCFSRDLRHDLFSHLLNLNFSKIDNIGTSTMITRMTADVNTIQNGVNMFLRLFLRSPFIVIGATVMAFTIDAESALIFVAVVVILFIVVGLIMKSNIPMLKKVQSKLDDVLCLTRENLSGVRVIRAFVKEDSEVLEFRDNNETLSRLQRSAGKISGLLNPLTYVIINLAIIVLISVGGYRASSGIITTGQVVALYNYMSQILLELIKFANLIVTINKALASANRISDVFDIEEGMEGIDSASSHMDSDYAIEFDDVSLRYHEDSDESLTGVSFKLEKGKTLGIIGGTGSGKTSLVSLIPRFYDATSGRVIINGEDVKTINTDDLRNSIGIVMQKAVLFDGSIKDNLLWGNENATDEEMMEAVRMAVAEDVVLTKGGLDSKIEAGGKNLSGGQRQRLTIARALVRKPEILILDDSSSALDYLTDSKLRSNIKSLSYNPTVVIVSQRTTSVADADMIIVLDDGDVVGMGTHNELLNNCDVYKEIHYSQVK